MAHSSTLPEQIAGTNSAVLPPAPVPLLHEDPQAERIYCDQAFEFLRAHPGLCSPQNPIHYSTLHASLTNIGVHPPYGNSKKAKALSLKGSREILSNDSRFVVQQFPGPNNSLIDVIHLACQQKGFAGAPEPAPDLHDSTAKGSESGSGNSSSSDTPTDVMDETSGRPKTKKAKADGGDAGAASAPAAVASHEITQKPRPAVALHVPSFSAAAAVGTVKSTDGGRVSTAGCTAAPSRACAAATAHSAPTAADCGSNTKCDDTKIMACLDLSRYLVTWMIMHPTISELHRYCIRMYVKLWADWMDSPPTASAEGSDGIPDPPCFRTCAILSQFMLRERLKMKLSDSPWRAYSNASLVIKNFLFIGAGNCSVSPIMLTQPPCPDDSEPTDFSFNQRKALLKQFYEDNNIRFIVNVSGRDDFMRSAEYPISANRTYSAAETSDLFTNLEEQPLEALQTHLNGDHVTVFLMHMEDVEHWPQEQVNAVIFQ
jgi:hypothetical protein